MNDFRPLVIHFPQNEGTATVDVTTLCYAEGHATGTQIQEVIAYCEQLADEASDPATDYEDEVRQHGVSANLDWDGDWDVTYVGGAQDNNRWNALHVYTFYYGSPGNVPPPVHETAKFQGVNGSCYGSSGLLRRLRARDPGVESLRAAAQTLGYETMGQLRKWIRTLDIVAERELTPPWFVREPCEKDGNWVKYKLPVNLACGPILTIDGKFLRETSISLAVESISIRRHARPPLVNLDSPLGTGTPAPSGYWRFPGVSQFGLVLFQGGGTPGTDLVQLIYSTSRAAPMSALVNPARPIRIAVNSLRTEDYLNEGYVNLWVRLNSH
jgi:hypothetical protein